MNRTVGFLAVVTLLSALVACGSEDELTIHPSSQHIVGIWERGDVGWAASERITFREDGTFSVALEDLPGDPSGQGQHDVLSGTYQATDDELTLSGFVDGATSVEYRMSYYADESVFVKAAFLMTARGHLDATYSASMLPGDGFEAPEPTIDLVYDGDSPGEHDVDHADGFFWEKPSPWVTYAPKAGDFVESSTAIELYFDTSEPPDVLRIVAEGVLSAEPDDAIDWSYAWNGQHGVEYWRIAL